MINQEGGSNNVVDHCCGAGNFVAAGAGDRLYDGLFYSYPAGQRHSGATRVVKQSSCPIKAKETGGSMKPKIIIAIILIALGIAAFAYQGITYTTREKVVDLGPIQVTSEKTTTIPLPPIVGAVSYT